VTTTRRRRGRVRRADDGAVSKGAAGGQGQRQRAHPGRDWGGQGSASKLHPQRIRRADKPFLKLNCAAVAETLLDSELFGHEPGAFTGANKSRKGLIQAADGGTLFVDEVGEMSLPMQAKLLRAAGQGEITRVGSTTVVKVDVRFVAATNRDLANDVKTGHFREDLYYRLAVFELIVRRCAIARARSSRWRASSWATLPRIPIDSLLTSRPMPWLSCFATTGRETSASFAT